MQRPSPNVTFTALGGEQASLSELGGQVVIMLFDLGCAPCRENDQLLRQYPLENLTHDRVVVSLEELQHYHAAFTFSIWSKLDPRREISRRSHVSPLPVTVFIDRDAFIRSMHWGQLTWTP